MNDTEDERIETSVDMDWVTSLEKKVSDTKFRDRNTEPTIYRVPDTLKKVDHEAYEPSIVSLGPYHRDKPHLRAMNQHKWKYLKSVLERNPEMVLKDYVDLVKGQETLAREAYSEEVNMSSDSFVEMMLLDGCFVMLSIMGYNFSDWWTRNVVVRDMFMLENQLPFFLLETLYESAFPYHDRDRDSFLRVTVKFIGMNFSSSLELPSDNEIFHHIIHIFLSCIDPTINHGNGNGNDNQSSSTFGFLCNSKLVKTVFVSLSSTLRSSVLSQVSKIRTSRDANPEENWTVSDLPWIPSATLCNEAGIHFGRKKRYKSFLDITFHNGKLEIPQLRIEDHVNSLLRNLIAYEQCSMNSKFHVTTYMVLMDSLIDTAADVELLQQYEIIIGNLGDSQKIATLFNKLGTNVSYDLDDFYLLGVLTAMRKHHDARCNKWHARLNRDYFSNPWAVISLFGALGLFVLTVIQTTFTILSYFRPPK
ncbi:UPF0481 protein At3g47200-like [Zingiber officinale]|uniref:Uncharacterized protein n=1 Tax=Zingiber officinale TaxID=94328 RepID=A0A8J5GRP5_ZINOF|nr:UPF0481 protein At3g47200-like [Zingiber officinale]KAG6512615.1 hypothetical protein ZIOFF_030740 [Zingiber officinale]